MPKKRIPANDPLRKANFIVTTVAAAHNWRTWTLEDGEVVVPLRGARKASMSNGPHAGYLGSEEWYIYHPRLLNGRNRLRGLLDRSGDFETRLYGTAEAVYAALTYGPGALRAKLRRSKQTAS